MAEGTLKMGNSQIEQIVKYFFDRMRHQACGPQRKRKLGSMLVEYDLLPTDIWKDIKGEHNPSTFWGSMMKNTARKTKTYELIMKWMIDNENKRDAQLFREKDIAIATGILNRKSQEEPATTVTFETFGFEKMDKEDNKTHSIIGILYMSPSIYLRENTGLKRNDIRAKIKRFWDQSAVFSELFPRREVLDLEDPLIIHCASNVFSLGIHVICLMKMEEVCFYPTHTDSRAGPLYIGRLQPGKYILLRKRDLLPEIERLKEKIEKLTKERDDAQREVETLQGRIDELGNQQRDVRDTLANLHRKMEQMKLELAEKDELIKLLREDLDHMREEADQQKLQFRRAHERSREKKEQKREKIKQMKGEMERVFTEMMNQYFSESDSSESDEDGTSEDLKGTE